MTNDLRDLQHDLRTALTVMTGYADLLSRPGEIPEDVRRDYSERILNAVMDLRDIIDTLGE